MITPVILISTCLVSIFISSLLVSACILAGRLDRYHLDGYEEP